jgi:hypothetical protein
MDFLLKQQDNFATIVIDNGDLLFAQIMGEAEDELNRELKAQDWRAIKGLWNSTLFAVGRSKQNFVMTVGRKDIAFTREEGHMPGIEGKMVIVPQDLPHAEKNVPRFVDLILKTDVQRDKLNRPTSIHTVTFVGGRRPPSIPPEQLHTGRVWKFDSRKEVDVWGEVIAPLDAAWSDGAVEHLGIDPKEVSQAGGEMKSAWEDQQVGSILASLRAAPDLDTLKRVWLDAEVNVNKDLPPNKRQIIIDEKERRKKELARG